MKNISHLLHSLECGLCHLCQFKIFTEVMCDTPTCINCPWNSGQWIQIKRWFHGSLRVAFHTQLEHLLLHIQPPTIKQRCNQWTWAFKPQKFWLIVPRFQYFQMLGIIIVRYTMPMALSKAQGGKQLSNSLINWLVVVAN
jgi:hypothetical protein